MDIDAVAQYINQQRGLLFSPYGYIDRTTALIFDAKQIRNAWRENRTYQWGHYDGSGEPIRMSIKDYFKNFVIDRNYLGRANIVTGPLKAQGNSIVNIREQFPDAIIAQFHVPGRDVKFSGMDWTTLYCVLVPDQQKGWSLIALVHDQWTI
jgi:hypothetical protein